MARFSVIRIIAALLIPGLLLLFAWPVSARAEELVDPMRPTHYQTPPSAKKSEGLTVDTTSWNLAAVLSAADRVIAVINGKSLQKGDVLQGYVLINIEPDHALLQNGEKQLVLRRVGTGLKKNIR